MEYITKFGEYLSENSKADKTVESYTGDIKGYIRSLGKKGIIYDYTLNLLAVLNWKNHLMEF